MISIAFLAENVVLKREIVAQNKTFQMEFTDNKIILFRYFSQKEMYWLTDAKTEHTRFFHKEQTKKKKNSFVLRVVPTRALGNHKVRRFYRRWNLLSNYFILSAREILTGAKVLNLLIKTA